MTSQIHGRIPDEPHGVSVAMPHHVVPYVKIFILLVILTVVTVAAYFLLMMAGVHNELVRVVVAITIAAVKASFVAMFFMHLKFEGKLIYLIAIIPLILTVLLVVALIPDIVHSRHFNELTPLPQAEPHVDGQQAQH
jgi:cytochrome c oxidase subunit 4